MPNVIAHLLSIGPVHFRFKSCIVVVLIFIQILTENFEKTNIGDPDQAHLVWVSTACLCPQKRTLCLYGLTHALIRLHGGAAMSTSFCWYAITRFSHDEAQLYELRISHCTSHGNICYTVCTRPPRL